MNITYKNATVWDAVRIIPLWIKMRQEIAIEGLTIGSGESDPERFFLELIVRTKLPEFVIQVAEIEGKIVGFVISHTYSPKYSDNKIIGSCLSVYVEPEHRNKGIAEHLIKSSIEIGKRMGIKEAEFITAYNPDLIKKWLTRGYIPVQVTWRKEI